MFLDFFAYSFEIITFYSHNAYLLIQIQIGVKNIRTGWSCFEVFAARSVSCGEWLGRTQDARLIVSRVLSDW